ncbi:MAG: magnesium transporter [Armatimonadetes bacterium]|nr:magnesium transporter [Armatimonadota bacterium]
MARRPNKDNHVNLIERIRSLAKSKNADVVKQELSGEFPEDIAHSLGRLPVDEGIDLLSKLDDLQAAAVMVELPTETARQYMTELPDTVLAAYLDVLPMDDALDLQEELDPERFEALLEVIPDEDAREIRRLMVYPKGSVGRVMTERFFEVKPDMSMWQLLADLRTAPLEKYETVNDVYVVDDDRFLQGIFSLRKALRADPETKASELMNKEVVVAAVEETDEDAARRMSKYGFYALPVVDDHGRMMGLFTGDDAQSILREADTKDVLALGAVSGTAESYVSLGVWQLFKRRFPWLLGLFVAESLTGQVMRHYGKGDELNLAPLTFFIPLIIGAGGNSGSQVTTTITRALAIGEITPRDWFLVVRREVVVAILIGLSLGVAGYLRAALPPPLGWSSGVSLSLVVASSLPAVVLWSASVGSLLPLTAKRMNLDPAVMSAPFISTFVDATGLVIYFEIALRILKGHFL